MKQLLPALALLFFSCGNQDFDQIAEQISQETGLEVELNSSELDTCMVEQVEKTGKEFSQLDGTQSANLKAMLKEKFDKIVVERSSVDQKKSGTLNFLVLYEFLCSDDDCWYEARQRKQIGGELKVEGERSSSRLEQDLETRTLTLRSSSFLDSHEEVEYMTTKSGLYAKIESDDTDLFKDSLTAKAITKRRTVESNGLKCLSDDKLLQKFLTK